MSGTCSYRVPIITANPANLSVSVRSLFPLGSLAAELRGPGDPAALFPDEAQCLRGAVPKRAQEFAAGRLCARRLLAEFGIEEFPLRVGEDRQPLWPDSLVGSITHTTGFCAAAVAQKNQIRALGIDSELAGGVKEELWRWICTPHEISWLQSLPPAEQPRAATLIFSAKESFYKCQFALTQERLYFHDATIDVQDWGTGRGAFEIRANRPIALAHHAKLPIKGQYLFHEEWITTGVAVTEPAAGP
jgi:4'-phosphopantetheinyl transferase EntD